jgi:hypothetical protein
MLRHAAQDLARSGSERESRDRVRSAEVQPHGPAELILRS